MLVRLLSYGQLVEFEDQRIAFGRQPPHHRTADEDGSTRNQHAECHWAAGMVSHGKTK
jgi:hypothetical protein